MQQQPVLGALFALIAAMAWGSLPLALQQVLAVMNAQSIVWYRFAVASLALFLLLGSRKKLPELRQSGRTYGWLVIIGVVGLAGNFFLFNSSLNYVSPAVAQIFIHLSSFMMLLCGVVIFKEKLGRYQKIGLGILLLGLGLFFNDRFDSLFGINRYSFGVMLSITAAMVWVGYGMAQKILLRSFSAQQILMMMYMGCALVFTPFVEITQVSGLQGISLICFIYCCLNTLIGYGAYAEALNRWEVSKVSVIITLVPLFTILFAHLFHYLLPRYFPAPELNLISYLGAFIVVLGAILSAVGHKLFSRRKRS
ncbi:EamA domain-containing membrane protein RarD [Mesocricetibacter intestinalis]|uniref:EamA domain-containing membrane protein RarD n=1 Tax=Mesocricetibacter intestinalis TaxID=1521930 RepID=A0A4R6VLN7_9PAST|nr:DMT family transporter [Mesocricetibacter intestinalis]TDQ59740.1 EamA domain-containing membrane protein RarD [Mesocricetibacter intestinalis]